MTGCKKTVSTYSFRQPQSNVSRVEICTYNHNADEITPLVQLSKEDADALLAELSSLECYEFFPLDTILSYGDIIISIAYLDGEVEVIGLYNIGWISPGGKLNTTRFYFDIEEIRNIIARYVDPGILSDVSNEF